MDVLGPDRVGSPAADRIRGPLQRHGARGEPGAERDDADVVADLDAAGIDGLGERERNRRGRRVPVPVEVTKIRSIERSRPFATASMILMLAWCGTNRSMSSAVRPAFSIEARAVEASVLVAKRYVSLPSIRMKCSRRASVPVDGGAAAPPAGTQIMYAPDGSVVSSKPIAPPGSSRGGQHDRPGAIAEEDARAAVGEVEEPGQRLRPDDEDVLRHPARDVRLRGGVRVGEARAGRHDVHREARVLPIASFTRAAVDGIQ